MMPLRLAALAVIFLATPLRAENVIRVPYAELKASLDGIIDFESIPKRWSPGLKLDMVQEFDGAAFAEGFEGQNLVIQNGFDLLQGRPLGPLTLRPGIEGQNLAVAFFSVFTNQLIGHAPPGYPNREANGEGAISVLFDYDQAAIGFLVAGEPEPEEPMPPGQINVSFFDRQGALIDQLDVVLDWGRKGYGFQRAGKQRDIAGVTITNSDPAGIAVDDVIFDHSIVVGALER